MAMLIRLPLNSRLDGNGQRIKVTYRERTVAAGGKRGFVRRGGLVAVHCTRLRHKGRGREVRPVVPRSPTACVGDREVPPTDLGNGEFVSRVGKSVKPAAAVDGGEMLDSVHGLMVYNQSDRDWIVFDRASGFSSRLPARLFAGALSSVEHDVPPVAEGTSLALACHLLPVHIFDQSTRAQFVTLVTAIEALPAHKHESTGPQPPRRKPIPQVRNMRKEGR